MYYKHCQVLNLKKHKTSIIYLLEVIYIQWNRNTQLDNLIKLIISCVVIIFKTFPYEFLKAYNFLKMYYVYAKKENNGLQYFLNNLKFYLFKSM